MVRRVLRVTGTGLVIAVALVTPSLATSPSASASDSTTVLVPSNNATVSGTQVVLDASAPGATSVQFEIQPSDSVLATATPTIYGWVATWNTITYGNGAYSLVSVATFPDNTTVTSPAVSITLDNPPPTATVVIPSNGATVSGTVAIDAVPNASTLSISIDVGPVPGDPRPTTGLGFATPTIYGWVVLWNTTGTANGTYYLYVTAANRATLQSTTQTLAITVDNPNPSAPSILVPSNNATVSGTQVVLDTTAPATEFFLTPGVSAPLIATATPTIYGEVALWNTTNVPNGAYTLYSATPSGQPAWSAGIIVTVDNPTPTATITSPQNGSTVSGTVLYQATPSPSYVAEVSLGITGPSFPAGTNLATLTSPGTPAWAIEWDTTSVANGTYTLQACAADPLGSNLSGCGPPITVIVAN